MGTNKPTHDRRHGENKSNNLPLLSKSSISTSPSDQFGGGILAMSNVGKTISTEWKKKNGVTIRWGVRIWWKGIRHDIYKIPVFDGHLIPCESEETAKQLKLIINNDILRGTFNPDRYKKEKKLHLEQYAKDWLKRRKDEISAATYHDYDNSIKNYIVPLLGNRYLGDIGSKDLEDFIKDVKRKPAGVQNVMGCLKKIMRDAKRWEDISELPIFPVVKVPEGPHRWYEMSEQMKIVDHLDEYAERLVLFMMLSGCRTAEARALRWQDIKKDHIEIAVTFDRNEDLKLPKNGEPDTIPLTDALRDLLDTVPGNDSIHVFVNKRTGKPYTKNFDRLWRKACKEAKAGYVKLYNATRHSFASQLANGGVDEAILSRLLRHKDRRSTRRYYSFKTEPLKVAVDNVIHLPKRSGKTTENKATVK